jgi:hypothetical protein
VTNHVSQVKKSKGKGLPIRKDVDLLAEDIGGDGLRKKAEISDVNPRARFVDQMASSYYVLPGHGDRYFGRTLDLSMKTKKYTNAGLRKDHAKASADSEKKKSMKNLKVLGGLSDEDIDDSEVPESPLTNAPIAVTYPEKLKRTGGRVNDVSCTLLAYVP